MDIITYALSKKYVDNSIKGISGTLAGKNCTISKTEEVEGGTEVTFAWTADDGSKKTTTIFVKNGEAEKDALKRVRLTSDGDDIKRDGVTQTFEQIRDLIMDEKLFVTLNLWDNMAFVPSSYNGTAIWFDSGFIMNNTPTQMRVIINNNNEVKVDQIDLATKESVQILASDTNIEINNLQSNVDGINDDVGQNTIDIGQLKEAVKTLSGAVTLKPVSQLPTTDIKTNVIYLLETGVTGQFDQYIYDEANTSWVSLGLTSVDLTGYTKQEYLTESEYLAMKEAGTLDPSKDYNTYEE